MTIPSTPPRTPLGERNWNLDVQIPEDHYDAVVRDALGGFAELEVRTGRLNVLLCAQPKSASLYTTQLLASTLDLANHQVGFARSGGGLYYPRLLLAKYVDGDTISHCHESPSGELLRLARQLEVRLVVLVRGLLNALLSRRDMLARGQGSPALLHPAAFERFRTSSPSEQLDFVIDAFAPTYLNFQAGWSELCHRERSPIVWASYEQLVRDEVAFVEGIASGLGRRVEPERVRAVSERIRSEGGINRSTGRSGRGIEEFEPAQLERVRVLARRYGVEDSALLGCAPE